MTMPTFLGIGVQRGGTTWLHRLLASHPDVYMPTRRKEVRFFDRDYERGLAWYETFFPPAEEAGRYLAIGEISPQYYYREECPERIYQALPDAKLMIMLRHPVARAYSNYGFRVQRWNYRGSFEDFLAARPRNLERGFYSRYLERYLRYFDRARILALLFEDVFADVVGAKETIAYFLSIDVDRFPSAAVRGKVNPSTVPTFRLLYGSATKLAQLLKKRNLHSVVDLGKRLGIPQVLAKGDLLPPLDEELKQRLTEPYQDEFDELERRMQIDLASWRE